MTHTAQEPETSAGERPWASIIIVNFNAGAFLQQAVDSVAAQTCTDYELILIDNASTDGSLNGLRTDLVQRFQLIRLECNTGFAMANNLAAKQANGTWLALLNPDATAAPGWLGAFRHATETAPEARMFAGAAVNMSNTNILDGAGDCYFAAGQPWRGGFGRPAHELPEPGTCFSPCGASALLHRETFLDTGGFDERFFCYCEDVDLGFRLRLEGHHCIFWPDALIHHYGGGSSGEQSDFAIRHGTRNRLWTFVKNMPPLALWLLLPFHILMTVLLVLRAIIRRQIKPTLAGLGEALSGIGPVLADRKTVQARRKLSSCQILGAMAWNPLKMLNRRPDVRPLRQILTDHSPEEQADRPRQSSDQ